MNTSKISKIIFLATSLLLDNRAYSQEVNYNNSRRDSAIKKELHEIEVITRKTNNTDVDLLNVIKSKNAIVSGISAEQIAKGQDRDAAEVIKRIPGVSLFDDRFIVVRGISQRYNNVWLNGISAPSSEADKRAFSFDVIPSTLIEQVLVYKTPSANLPGDFAGGMVKISTKTASMGHEFHLDLNGFCRDGTTFQKLQFTDGSKTDFIGYGSTFRDIPKELPPILNQSSSSITKLFKNTWVLHDKTAMPDLRLSTSYAFGFKVGKVRIGSISALSYANEYSRNTIEQYDYSTSVATIVADDPTSAYKDVQSTNLVRLGFMQNFSVIINPVHKFEFKTLFNQTGRNQSTVRTGIDEDANIRYYRFGYQQKALLTSQFSYTFIAKNHKDKYSAIAGYSLNKRADPDLRQITYQYPPDTFFRSNIPAGSGQLDITEGATRFYSKLQEHIYSFNQEYNHAFKIASCDFIASLGSYIEYKDRSFNSRMFGYTLPVTSIRRFMTGLPINEIFTDKYIDAVDTNFGQNKAAGFTIRESTDPSNSYTGQNRLLAPYIMVDFKLLKRLEISTGVRMEDNTQYLQTVVGVDSIHINNHTSYYLPSINMKYELNQESVLRFAYGETVNRPEFREWAPYLYYDFELFALAHGTLFPSVDHKDGYILKTATIHNFDLRYEMFPSANEMFNIGVFYKQFFNPIEQIAEAHEHRTGVSRELTFHNADAAYCYGIETEIWKNLDFADKWFGTSIMKQFSFIANVSLIKSQVSNNTDSNLKNRPLQGQAPYIINAGLHYSSSTISNAWQVSLLYNIIGPYIFLAGGTDGAHTASGPSLGQMAKHNLDFTLSKNINSLFSISIGIKDILNQSIRLVEDTNQDGKFTSEDKVISSYKRGSYYTIGLKLKI